MKKFKQLNKDTQKRMILDLKQMLCRGYIQGSKSPTFDTFDKEVKSLYKEALEIARNMDLEEGIEFLIECIEPFLDLGLGEMLDLMIFQNNGKIVLQN